MNNIPLPTAQDIKIFKLVKALLSQHEFVTLVKFYKEHESLSSDERDKLYKTNSPSFM